MAPEANRVGTHGLPACVLNGPAWSSPLTTVHTHPNRSRRLVLAEDSGAALFRLALRCSLGESSLRRPSAVVTSRIGASRQSSRIPTNPLGNRDVAGPNPTDTEAGLAVLAWIGLLQAQPLSKPPPSPGPSFWDHPKQPWHQLSAECAPLYLSRLFNIPKACNTFLPPGRNAGPKAGFLSPVACQKTSPPPLPPLPSPQPKMQAAVVTQRTAFAFLSQE